MNIPLPHWIDWQINRHFIMALVIFATAAIPQRTVIAQQETPENVASEESKDLPEFITFQLRHADADIVMNVLQTLLAGEAGARLAIGEDGRIILHGTPPVLAKVREALKVLDQPPEDRSMVKVFSLIYSDAAEAADLVTRMVDDANVAFDVRTNSLIVSAPNEETLDKIEALAEILDRGVAASRTEASYHLELFWLIEGAGEEESPAVDRRIAKAAVELERHGFAEARQVGHVSVIVSPGGEFRIRSNESLGQLDVQGELSGSEDEQMELKLELAIIDNDEEIASVMTEFNTRPEHEVVIGIANARNHDRRSAFVIRVDR